MAIRAMLVAVVAAGLFVGPAVGRTAATCAVHGVLPDRACTPGATFPHVTARQVCVRGYAGRVRNVPESEKRAVYARYGIATHSPGQYEVDHLVSLELGGSNVIANLWPEAAEPRPGFHEKDRVENYLHARVCDGQMTLRRAQRLIATDWLKVWAVLSH
ncbi:MAG: HNH endonuclease [Actinobacteria bacterium]|nr:MAG: HNH endonuclease [Actinomycetota bacterium]